MKMSVFIGVVAAVAGAGLIALGLREAPPRCSFCGKHKKTLPRPARTMRGGRTHYCYNHRCERYEFGGPALRFGDER